MKCFALNFCFAYCLPREQRLIDGLAQDSDNEGMEDELVLALDEDDLLEATRTHIKGSKPVDGSDHRTDVEEKTNTTKLHDMTREMFEISSAIWQCPASAPQNDRAETPPRLQSHTAPEEAIQDHALAKKSAENSRRKEKQNQKPEGLLGVPANAPGAREGPEVTTDLLRDWLHSSHVQGSTNAEQHHFLSLVVDRTLVEYGLLALTDTQLGTEAPMCHLLHGPPGSGKSHCLVFLRELFELLGFKQGIDYEVVAYQAVNASALGGDTIHMSCGFKSVVDASAAVAEATAKRIAYWRWLFIDEISMVSARLLAQLDHRICSVKPDGDAFKLDSTGRARRGPLGF